MKTGWGTVVAALCALSTFACGASALHQGGDRAAAAGNWGAAMATYEAAMVKASVEEKEQLTQKRAEMGAKWISEETARARALEGEGKVEEAYGIATTLAREAKRMNLAESHQRVVGPVLDGIVATLAERAIAEAAKTSDKASVAIDRNIAIAESLGADLPESAASRAKLRELEKAASAEHAKRAAAAGDMRGVRLLHSRLTKRYWYPSSDLALAERMATPRFDMKGASRCDLVRAAMDGAFTSGEGMNISVEVRDGACEPKETRTTTNETKRYTAIEKTTKIVPRQVCHNVQKYANTTCQHSGSGSNRTETCTDNYSTMQECTNEQVEEVTAVEVEREERVLVKHVTYRLDVSGGLRFVTSDGVQKEMPFTLSEEIADEAWSGTGTSQAFSKGDMATLRANAANKLAASVRERIRDFGNLLADTYAQRAAAAEREGRTDEAEDLHVLGAWYGKSVNSAAQAWLTSRYSLTPEQTQKLLVGDGRVEPAPSPLAYKLQMPLPDQGAVAAEKEVDDTSAGKRAALYLELAGTGVVSTGVVEATRFNLTAGARAQIGRELGNDDFDVGGHIDLHAGADNRGNIAFDSELGLVPEWKAGIVGFGPLFTAGIDGFGGRNDPGLFLPLGLYFGLGGQIALWPRSKWNAHVNFQHAYRLLQLHEIPEFVDEENRGELRLHFHKFSGKSVLAVAVRYTDYVNQGSGLGAHLGYDF